MCLTVDFILVVEVDMILGGEGCRLVEFMVLPRVQRNWLWCGDSTSGNNANGDYWRCELRDSGLGLVTARRCRGDDGWKGLVGCMDARTRTQNIIYLFITFVIFHFHFPFILFYDLFISVCVDIKEPCDKPFNNLQWNFNSHLSCLPIEPRLKSAHPKLMDRSI